MIITNSSKSIWAAAETAPRTYAPGVCANPWKPLAGPGVFSLLFGYAPGMRRTLMGRRCKNLETGPAEPAGPASWASRASCACGGLASQASSFARHTRELAHEGLSPCAQALSPCAATCMEALLSNGILAGPQTRRQQVNGIE